MLVLFLALAIGFAASGCNNQAEEPITDREARMVLVENRELQQQIVNLESELAAANEQLEESRQEKERLQHMVEEQIQKNVQDILSHVMDSNRELREENQQLQQEIERLKGEQSPQENNPTCSEACNHGDC